jgi:hypothetical protein
MLALALILSVASAMAPDEKFGNRGGNSDPKTIDSGVGESYTCWEGALPSATIFWPPSSRAAASH